MGNTVQIHICQNFLRLIQDFFCLDLGNVIQGRNCLRNDLGLAVTLDVAQLVHLTANNKVKCDALAARTAGTSDTMYIILIILRDIVVKYCLYIIYVNTTRSNIGCYQDLSSSVAEAVHNAVTLYLL